MREVDLYPAVKALLVSQGYEVKAEVGAADVLALRAGEPPVVVELKLGFSLALFHQAIDRLKVTDGVYIAVAHRPGKRFVRALKENVSLARRLGLGVMTVRLRDQLVLVHCDPGPYQPRKSARREGALLREFARRRGDPNKGGQTRIGLMTAYRQDALRIAAFLLRYGDSKGAAVAGGTGVPQATRMMADNHYGWFERVTRGVYRLSSQGIRVLEDVDPLPAD
ncbi:MAG: DUF2161 family putative PD-(D/E)XK-type phosphodiesterase [Pseudomonadota bacterium]